MDTNPALERAKLATKQGDKVRARAILREVLKQEPQNETAWLLLSEVTEKPEQAIQCLERVLKLNPTNQVARAKLEKIEFETSSIDNAKVNRPQLRRVQKNERQSVQSPSPQLKPCPYCAELIQETAIACRFCGRDITKQSSKRQQRAWSAVEIVTASVVAFLALAIVVMVAILVLSILKGRISIPFLPTATPIPTSTPVPGSLSGTVSWETQGLGNKVVVGITVRVVDRENPDFYHPVGIGITDALGNYTINNLPPGKYGVAAFQLPSAVGEQIAAKCWLFADVEIKPGQTTQVFMDFYNSVLCPEQFYAPR